MSNKHYTQYSRFSGEEPMPVQSNDLYDEDHGEIIDENESVVTEEPIEGQTMIPEVKTVPDPEPVVEPEIQKFGQVSDCKKLNVRKLPSRDAEIVSELAEGIKVMIDEKTSTALFYKICTEHGIEGYCMKDFIKVLA